MDRLASSYTLRLVIPHHSSNSTLSSDDDRAIAEALGVAVIPHETAEGVIHVCRALGGLTVIAEGAKPAPPCGSVPLPLDQVVRDIRTFVRGVMVLRLEEAAEREREVGDTTFSSETARGVTVVESGGWQALLSKLDV